MLSSLADSDLVCEDTLTGNSNALTLDRLSMNHVITCTTDCPVRLASVLISEIYNFKYLGN